MGFSSQVIPAKAEANHGSSDSILDGLQGASATINNHTNGG